MTILQWRLAGLLGPCHCILFCVSKLCLIQSLVQYHLSSSCVWKENKWFWIKKRYGSLPSVIPETCAVIIEPITIQFHFHFCIWICIRIYRSSIPPSMLHSFILFFIQNVGGCSYCHHFRGSYIWHMILEISWFNINRTQPKLCADKPCESSLWIKVEYVLFLQVWLLFWPRTSNIYPFNLSIVRI